MAMTPAAMTPRDEATKSYLAGQRDAFKDVLLQESLPLQKLVERQKQKVEVLTKKQEKMEDEVREQSIVSAVLIERTNVEKEHVFRMEEMGAKLCASVEKLEREVIVLKSAEKEKKGGTENAEVSGEVRRFRCLLSRQRDAIDVVGKSSQQKVVRRRRRRGRRRNAYAVDAAENRANQRRTRDVPRDVRRLRSHRKN